MITRLITFLIKLQNISFHLKGGRQVNLLLPFGLNVSSQSEAIYVKLYTGADRRFYENYNYSEYRILGLGFSVYTKHPNVSDLMYILRKLGVHGEQQYHI